MDSLRAKIKKHSEIPIDDRSQGIYRSICIIFIGILACIIIIVGILLGLFGITQKIRNRPAESVVSQWETKCFVFQSSCYRHQCNYCDYNSTNCPKSTCYDQKTKVSYPIFNGSQILSSIIDKNNPNKPNIQVGFEYTCYYDQTSHFKSVKWDNNRPKSQILMISVGIALIVVAIIIVVLVAIYLIFVERPRLNKLQRRDKMLRHISAEEQKVEF